MEKFLKKILEDKKLKTFIINLSNNKSFELNTLENKVCMKDDCLQFVYDGELYTVNPTHIVTVVENY